MGDNMSPSDLRAVIDASNDSRMPYPMYNSGFGSGFGNGDGSWIWLILILVLFGNNGWGNGNGGFGGGNFNNEYAWLSNGQKEIMQNTTSGFDSLQLGNQISDIANSVNGINTQLCNGFAGVNQNLCSGFAGVNQTVSGGFASAEIAANGRQMANMQQSFNNQLATLQGFNGVTSQLCDASAENRLGQANLTATILSENCADRYEAAKNTRDIIDNANRNNQAIIDKLCQLELDGFKRENDQLRSQLQFANLQASQVQQTADLRTSQATVANQLVSELRSCPIPSQPVYGNQPIFTCNGNNNYGCGCNGNF